jgi:hypothetical protein
MPFRTMVDDTYPDITLRRVPPASWQLLTSFRYDDPVDGRSYPVPAHNLAKPAVEPANATDLASVPPFLWNLISAYGHQTLPALLHDKRCYLAELVQQRWPERWRDALAARDHANELFRRALIEEGVSIFRARVMWIAVSFAGMGTHRKPWLKRLVARVVIGWALLLVAMCTLPDFLKPVDPHGNTRLWLVAGAVATFCAGKRARLVWSAVPVAPILVPIAALQGIFVYGVFALGWLVFKWKGGPMPVPHPTLRLFH